MPRLLVLLASLCFATTGTAQALGPAGTTPITVGAARIVVGALLLVAAAKALATPKQAMRWPRAPVIVMSSAIALYQLCFFAAVAETGVAVGTVVALGSAPALAGLLSSATGGERLTRRWAGATALACSGVALLVVAGGDATDTKPLGIALALGAGAGYALFTVAGKRLLTLGHASEAVMARGFGLGAILLAPVLVVGDASWALSAEGAALALFLGAVPTALAYTLFARGLRRLSPNETATLTLAEPVTATALGAVLLGEQVGGAAAAGIVLVLAGLVMLALPAHEKRRIEPLAATR